MCTCFNCGNHAIWQNDWMLSELYGIDYDEDDDRVVIVLYCPTCHSEIYVVHPSPNMDKEFEEEEKKEEDTKKEEAPE